MKNNILMIVFLFLSGLSQVTFGTSLVNLLKGPVAHCRGASVVATAARMATASRLMGELIAVYTLFDGSLSYDEKVCCAYQLLPGEGKLAILNPFIMAMQRAADTCSYFTNNVGPQLSDEESKYYNTVYDLFWSAGSAVKMATNGELKLITCTWPSCAARHFIKGDY